MKPGSHLPEDQAELTFSDRFVDQLEALTEVDRLDVLAAVVALCGNPGGDQTLSARSKDRTLVGWNTLAVNAKQRRVVYHVDEAGASIYVLCLGPRRDPEVDDMATALAATGALTDDEVTQLWDALGLFEVLAENLGLDGWDYRPEPAPQGMQRTAVASGLLEEALAALLSRDELQAAIENGWGTNGPDPAKVLAAALARARGSATYDSATWSCRAERPTAAVRSCLVRAGHVSAAQGIRARTGRPSGA